MEKIIIIKAGDTFEDMVALYGGFDQWIADRLNVGSEFVRVVDVEHGEKLPDPQDCLGAVMTGSHSMVTDKLEWSEETARWVREAILSGMPYFGICYGHQLLAHAMGGDAAFNINGMEIGTVSVCMNENAASDILFQDVPKVISAHVIHSQSAVKLPEAAVCLASNDHDDHHAFRVGEHAWGVQFHPEFSSDVMKSYLEKYRKNLSERGKDVDGMVAAVKDTPEAESLLAKFAAYCLG